MKELTCFIRYSPVSKTAATAVCVGWFVLAAALVYTFYPLVHPLFWIFQLLIWLAAGLAFIYVPFVVVSSYCEGGLLVVTDDGITFPPPLFGFGSRLSIQWGDLSGVDYGHSQLRLVTKGKSKIKIKTNKIPESEVEQLLFAIEVWNPKVMWSQAATDLKDDLQNAKLGITCDFTRMWESELKRRYSATTFAPHMPQTKLQNGRLTILKQLAFGGFSAVYLAEDEDRQTVVIKELVMNCDEATKPKALEMFDRESRLLARVDHPNIAHVRDHFVEENRHYLVLEYIDGQNLRELVARKGSLDEKTVIALAIKMASILEYLHELKPPLVHKDFTPDNLILAASGELTLVDFGAANECASEVTGTLVGKQSYMPIEQIRGKPELRSDLYALGCTIYYLITGKDPEPLSVLHVPRASDELDRIIQRLTQIEPCDRFANAGEVRSALSQVNQSGSSIAILRSETHNA